MLPKRSLDSMAAVVAEQWANTIVIQSPRLNPTRKKLSVVEVGEEEMQGLVDDEVYKAFWGTNPPDVQEVRFQIADELLLWVLAQQTAGASVVEASTYRGGFSIGFSVPGVWAYIKGEDWETTPPSEEILSRFEPIPIELKAQAEKGSLELWRWLSHRGHPDEDQSWLTYVHDPSKNQEDEKLVTLRDACMAFAEAEAVEPEVPEDTALPLLLEKAGWKHR